MPAARRWRIIAGAVLLPLISAAAPSDGPEQIGSWLLQCPGSGGCILRDRDWILPPGAGRPAAALEVQRRGDRLVPVVTLRGLTGEQAIGGLLALQPHATLQFGNGGRADLACDLDGDAVICAPQGDAVAATAAALRGARQVEVGVQLGVRGMMPLPSQGRSLALQDTQEALARLRSAGAAGEALPAEPGLDWIGFVRKIITAAGVIPPALSAGAFGAR